MGRINTVIFSDNAPGVASGTPSSGCSASISITAGNQKSTKVGVRSEGLIKKLAVVQSSGASVPFKVELLCSKIPFPPGETASNSAGVQDLRIYRIQDDELGASAGDVCLLASTESDNEMGYAYRNVDGDYTNNQNCIYLLINPQGAVGTTKWDVQLVTESNNA